MSSTVFTLQIQAIVILFCEICSASDFLWFINSDKTSDILFNHNESSYFYPSNFSDTDIMSEFINETTYNTPKKWTLFRLNRKHQAMPILRRNQVFRDEPSPEPGSTFIRDINRVPTKDSLATINTILQARAVDYFLTKNLIPQIKTTTLSDFEFYYLNDNIDLPKQSVRTQHSSSSHKMNFNKLIHLQTTAHNEKNKIYEKVGLNIDTTRKIPPLERNTETLSFSTGRRVERDGSSISSNAFVDKTSPAMPPLRTENDRIKFFEVYDSLTQLPGNQEDIIYNDGEIASKHKIQIEDKVNLEIYGLDFGHKTVQYPQVKKHGIVERDVSENVPITNNYKSDDLMKSTLNYYTRTNTTEIKHLSSTVPSKKETTTAGSSSIDFDDSAYEESMVWSRYPFAAVYVYEQLRVHCDAAAINQYWLVASAACLSRHREDPLGEDRSAFIAYCGDNWWSPERINYVKSTQIHPKFNPRDTTRRHVYNIGVIQVITSMATSCPGWAPVTVMSHQYKAQDDLSVGLAVGWGLDRYDTTYSSSDLPKRSMAVYKGLIYSEKCPGNSGYSITKLTNPETTKNVYCLTLPLYHGEANDPVHGGLLLVGGKLIALYLQEERQKFGEQSAQYTGIWKLLPWILDIAKEPEEFKFSI